MYKQHMILNPTHVKSYSLQRPLFQQQLLHKNNSVKNSSLPLQSHLYKHVCALQTQDKQLGLAHLDQGFQAGKPSPLSPSRLIKCSCMLSCSLQRGDWNLNQRAVCLPVLHFQNRHTWLPPIQRDWAVSTPAKWLWVSIVTLDTYQ